MVTQHEPTTAQRPPWELRPHYLPLEPGERPDAVYVYQWPVRLWHWLIAVCIFALAATGFLIGTPPPSVGGEASANYWFGTIRFVHFAAGQVFAVAFVARIWMAIFGNEYARGIFILPVWDKRWWKALWGQQLYYLFLRPKAQSFHSHNPLAQAAMFFMFTLPSAWLVLSGMALYAEGTGVGSWQYAWFGWVLTLVGSSFLVHTLHHLAMWVMLTFVTVHLYLAFREDIMADYDVVSVMVNGWRQFKWGQR